MLRRIAVLIGLSLAMLGLLAGTAVADHGVAHNGETAEVSKTTDLAQDDVVTVTGIGYAPGSTLTVVQCFIFPAAGPADCELSNFGQFTAEVGDDGSASVDYVVNIVEGRCDADNPCFIVISDGIGPAANGVGTEVTFAAAEEAVEETTTTEAATTTTEAPTTTTEAPTTTTEAPTTTEAATDDAGDDDSSEAAAAEDDSSDDDDGGGSGVLIAVIVVLVLLAAVGAFLASRNKK